MPRPALRSGPRGRGRRPGGQAGRGAPPSLLGLRGCAAGRRSESRGKHRASELLRTLLTTSASVSETCAGSQLHDSACPFLTVLAGPACQPASFPAVGCPDCQKRTSTEGSRQRGNRRLAPPPSIVCEDGLQVGDVAQVRRVRQEPPERRTSFTSLISPRVSASGSMLVRTNNSTLHSIRSASGRPCRSCKRATCARTHAHAPPT